MMEICMTRDEKINFIGRVVSGEVNRLSDDDMVVMNELSMDVGDDFSVELIEEWLEKHDMLKFVDKIVWGKPNAKYYIDDKGIRFINWKDTLKEINV